MPSEIPHLNAVLAGDAAALENARKHYGESWCKRGGAGAFFMLARKWDRLENHLGKRGFDVLTAIKDDQRAEGVIDDVRDLRRYLALVEAKAVELGFCPPPLAKDASIERGSLEDGPAKTDEDVCALAHEMRASLHAVHYGEDNVAIAHMRLRASTYKKILDLLGNLRQDGMADEDDTPPANVLHPE